MSELIIWLEIIAALYLGGVFIVSALYVWFLTVMFGEAVVSGNESWDFRVIATVIGMGLWAGIQWPWLMFQHVRED